MDINELVKMMQQEIDKPEFRKMLKREHKKEVEKMIRCELEGWENAFYESVESLKYTRADYDSYSMFHEITQEELKAKYQKMINDDEFRESLDIVEYNELGDAYGMCCKAIGYYVDGYFVDYPDDVRRVIFNLYVWWWIKDYK